MFFNISFKGTVSQYFFPYFLLKTLPGPHLKRLDFTNFFIFEHLRENEKFQKKPFMRVHLRPRKGRKSPDTVPLRESSKGGERLGKEICNVYLLGMMSIQAWGCGIVFHICTTNRFSTDLSPPLLLFEHGHETRQL